MIKKQSHFTLTIMLSVLFTALTPSTTFTDISLQAQNECYKDNRDGWKYVEFLLIEQPKHQLDGALAQAQATLVALGALVILKNDIYTLVAPYFKNKNTVVSEKPKYIKALMQNEAIDEETNEKRINYVEIEQPKTDKADKFDIKTSVAQITIGKLVYDAYANYMKKSIQKTTLVNFLKNLETYQNHIPSELVPAFSELATRKDNLTDSEVAQVFEIIQHLLEHTFSGRYKTDAKSPDVLGTLKTFSDLGKNFNG